MRTIQTDIPDVIILEPTVFGDERGFFVETFRESAYRDAGIEVTFVQDNQSRSLRGVLRGLHYQMVRPQGKLVRVSRGEVFDVAVDIRRGSPTFGRWVGCRLDDVSHRQMYIPPGLAHGFFVLSDVADFVYKCTDYYDPESERGIAWDDPEIGIEWPKADVQPVLSGKDRANPRLAEQEATELPEFQPKSRRV